MSQSFLVVASLSRTRWWSFTCWTAQVTDPASPLLGLAGTARSASGARRALARLTAMALVDDRFEELPDAVEVTVISQSQTVEVPLSELAQESPALREG